MTEREGGETESEREGGREVVIVTRLFATVAICGWFKSSHLATSFIFMLLAVDGMEMYQIIDAFQQQNIYHVVLRRYGGISAYMR